MVISQEFYLSLTLLIWLILGLFKTFIVFITDKENRDELLFHNYPIGINLYKYKERKTIQKARQFYMIISYFSIIFIAMNMFFYSGILRDIFYDSFIKLFFVFCFYLVFWVYFFFRSFLECLGLWGGISKICVVLAFIGYINNSYSIFWNSIIFIILGIPFFISGIIGFIKLGASYGNPQGRTIALNNFFIGSINSLFMLFFILSPIIHSKFICI